MSYRICKILEVENGHMLSKHPDNCRFPHGHSRQVEIVLEADQLDANEMVCDFKVVKTALKGFLDSFDHAMCMNTDDPMYQTMKKAYGERIIGIEKQDPTTEIVARMMYDRVKACLDEYRLKEHPQYPLGRGVRLVRLRVWETSSSWAEFEEQT